MFISWKMGIMRILYLLLSYLLFSIKTKSVFLNFSPFGKSAPSFIALLLTQAARIIWSSVCLPLLPSQWPWWMKASRDGTLSNKYVAQASDKRLSNSLTCWRRVIPSAHELLSHRKSLNFSYKYHKVSMRIHFTSTNSSVSTPASPRGVVSPVDYSLTFQFYFLHRLFLPPQPFYLPWNLL